MKKNFLFFLFLFSGFLFANSFDFSLKSPSIFLRSDFSYSLLNNVKKTGFYSSTRGTLDFSTLNVDFGYQLAKNNSDFTFRTMYGPNIQNKMNLKFAFTLNHTNTINFAENNLVFGIHYDTQPSEIFKFASHLGYLLKLTNISTSNLKIPNHSMEIALYFDWFALEKLNPFLYVETSSFFNHFLFCSVIFSLGCNYQIIEKLSLGSSLAVTYVDFFTVSPYHSEISINTFVKFQIR